MNLTKENIKQIGGRELDAAVAEHVMGWRVDWPPHSGFGALANWYGLPPGMKRTTDLKEIPHFSREIALAWDVLRAVAAKPSFIEWWNESLPAISESKPADAADRICRAALLAVFATPAPAAGRGAE